MSRSRNVGCLTLLVLAVILAALLMYGMKQLPAQLEASAGAQGKEKGRFDEMVVEKGTGGKILLLDISGVIMRGADGFGEVDMVAQATEALKQAREDEEVKAVVLHVDSPGGGVTASDTIYHEVKKTVEVKPVVVFMDSMAASGGYYISAPATHIVANETTLTGSIGVIIQALQYQEAMGKLGVAPMTFTSGEYKDILSGSRPMREEERALIQNLVQEMYERFLSVVAEGREMDKAVLRDGIADGRIFSGKGAKEKGLVDELGYLENAIAKARELIGDEDASVVKYFRQGNLFDVLRFLGQAESKPTKVELSLPGVGTHGVQLRPGQLYYLPAGWVR